LLPNRVGGLILLFYGLLAKGLAFGLYFLIGSAFGTTFSISFILQGNNSNYIELFCFLVSSSA